MKNTIFAFYNEIFKNHGSDTAIITADGKNLSFSQVKDRAAALVSLLEKKNVRKGALIAIHMDRNTDYLISVCACILYGYGFIPLDTAYPKERVEMILEESKADFVIDEKVFSESEKEEPVSSWDYEPEESSIAYFVFTSGSTGRPKGIVHDQSSLAGAASRLSDCFALKPGDIWGISAPYTFVAFNVEFIATLFSGAAVRVIPREIVKDADLLASFIAENGITATFIPPRILRHYRPVGESLRLVITGGEKIVNIGPSGFRLIAAYGQSETCGPCIMFDVDKPYENTPVGTPTKGTAIYLLDEEDKETDEGEICIAGHFMNGYVNLPEESKKVVRTNPFRDKDGFDTCIHTGDLGKRLQDGNIIYINRKDWMIKINGQRVEPGEIEIRLREVEGVSDAVVKSFENRFGQPYICAYFTSNEKMNGDVLRESLRKKLPSYMVPSFFVQLDELPLNVNRKLDRNALKEPDASLFQEEYKEPSDEVEATLCRAFEDVLGLKRVGVNDDFFKLGGDSFKAIVVANECASIHVSVKNIFVGKTPKGIAEYLSKLTEDYNPTDSDLSEIPLSDSQLGVFLDKNDDAPDCKYNIPFVITYSADSVDVSLLKQALEKTFAKHQAFSLSAKVSNGVPVMYKTGKYPQVATAELSESEYEKLKDKFVQPFEFNGEPLFRAVIVKTKMYVHLLFDAHHLFFDGFSLGVLKESLTDYLNGREPENEVITPFMVSASDRRFKDSKAEKDCLDFYKDALNGCDADSNIKRDVYLPESESVRGSVETTVNHDCGSIEFFTKTHGITENTLFASAFALALAKFNCQTDCLFVSVDNGRTQSGLSKSIGMFVRTFPVLISIDETTKVSEYLNYVQKSFFDFMAHDSVSFHDIANACGISADVKYVYQSELLKDVEIIPVDDAMSNMDFMVIKQNGGYKISVGYRKSMYSNGLIQSFVQSFCAIVSGLIECDCLNEIKLVTDEQERVLDSFNRTDKEYDRDLGVIDLLKKQVSMNPDKVAVSFKDKKITYAEFDSLTDRIASFLNSEGIGKDCFVPVLIGRSQYMPVLAYGVVKSGAAYQPLDPTYPAERINFMVEDSKAKLVIADRQYAGIIEGFTGTVLYTEDVEKLPDMMKPTASVSPETGLVLLYTSGTTGLPKGFTLSHGNIASFVFSHSYNMKLDGDTRFASYAGFGFDACIMDIFSVLSAGGTLCIVPDEIRLDLNALCRFYIDEKITHGFITTQLGCMLAQTIDSPYLKYFMVGGEKLIPFNPSEKFDVLNGYGPSECIAYVTHFKVQDNSPIQPIGKPSFNMRLYITDNYGRRLPIGASGELLISGPQVSKGYLNRPEMTEKAFVKNRFDSDPEHDRIYKTGDIVRILPDGNLDFVGRRDGQVKVRGFRIELSEVETVIRKYNGIKNATVQAFDNASGGKYLAAFITSDSKVDIEDLNLFIESEKPAYMVPAITMQIESIPLTPNGKVDKRKLPVPVLQQEEIIEPKTELQKEILGMFCTVTGNKNVGINSNMFRSGLSSLGVIRLNAMLSDTFNVAVQIRDLKENNTVELLANFIESANREEEVPVIQYSDFPMTKTQEGIFLECQNDAKSTTYNIPYLVKISRDLDIKLLKAAICEAIQAHNYVNTILFYDNNGNVRQKLAPAGAFTTEDIELIKAQSLDSVKDSLVKPFNLIGGKLFRVCLIDAEDLYLFLDFHHIICDGTSMSILVSDIEQAYAGHQIAEEKFTGYHIALSEQKARNSRDYVNAEEYYNNLLSGSDTDFLPRSDVHVYAEKGSGKLLYCGRKNLAEKVSQYCNKNKVTENAVLCSAFGYVLSAYNGSENSLFTTVYNGRNDSRMGQTVSMLVKTLPVVFNPTENSVRANIGSMSSQLMNSMSNDVYSFAEISRSFGIKSDVMFIFQGRGFVNKTFCDRECNLVSLELSEEKSPLSIQVTHNDGYYDYEIGFDGNRFTDSFAKCLASVIDETISQITEVESFRDICLTDEDTLKELDKINCREVPYNSDETVVDMLKKHVSLSPDMLAVSYGKNKYTYKQFDSITDNLAALLSSKGVGKNSYVAIMIGRSEFMPITSWGVVKAGACYVPIDITYPKDRINLMLSDTGAEVLITERSLKDYYCDFNGSVIFTDEILSLPEVNGFHAGICGEDPLILIYSSGSTGVPKGSILPHRSITAFVFQHLQNHDMRVGEKIASYASFGFDAGMMDIFTALSSGLSLYIIPEEIRLDVPAMEKFYCENAINHGFMTTQVARLFLQNTKCSTLKSFLFGGEKMVPFTPPENVNVFNGYGPSETCNYVTIFHVADDSSVQPIGKQIPNSKLYVLDKEGRRLPPYACGELCVAGPQVGLGYLNRPEKTAGSFVVNPFCQEKEYSTLYKTGDIVRMFADGNYDFVGRRDGQVKVRGFRIELGEVEQIISEYDTVKQVTAQVFDDANGGKFIAAYIVADSKLDMAGVAAFIRKTKPAYMVPGFMIQLDSIPLTVNGKVNKAKLPAPQVMNSAKGAEPENAVEKNLCDIFASILGLKKVYADDDFFEIGGTSILALQLVVRCDNAGYAVVYKNVFENPTPRLLSKLIQGESKPKDFFAPSGEEAEKYNYSALEYNVVENLDNIRNDGIGDVLLLGATGFLGIHVLKYLLDSTDSKVICIVRSKSKLNSKKRLSTLANYYFEDDFERYFGSRVLVLDSDLADASLSEKLSTYHFDTIINCAANVHHFDSEEALMRDNYQIINRLIDIAKSRKAKLVQASSLSVSGESVNNHIDINTVFHENNLNIGQSLENMYIRTKYLAEQEIIDACSKGLRGKIIRLGNLMARNADGEFQINSGNNGFLRIVNAYRILGCYPIDALDVKIEFTPIDYAAKAVVMLAGTPDEFTVFHANNAHSLHLANVIEVMNDLGYKIDYVDSADFAEKYRVASAKEELADKLSGLLSYRNRVGGEGFEGSSQSDTRIKIDYDNVYTVKALYRLGFSWPLTDKKYLTALFKNLKSLNYFD